MRSMCECVLRQFAALSAMVAMGKAPIKVLHNNNNNNNNNNLRGTFEHSPVGYTSRAKRSNVCPASGVLVYKWTTNSTGPFMLTQCVPGASSACISFVDSDPSVSVKRSSACTTRQLLCPSIISYRNRCVIWTPSRASQNKTVTSCQQSHLHS